MLRVCVAGATGRTGPSEIHHHMETKRPRGRFLVFAETRNGRSWEYLSVRPVGESGGLQIIRRIAWDEVIRLVETEGFETWMVNRWRDQA